MRPAGGQRETGISGGHQIEHARVQVVIRQIVFTAEGQGRVAGHALHQGRRRLARLRAVKSPARWHAGMTAVPAAQEDGADVDTFRRRAALDAELKTFPSGPLQSDFTRQFGGERQIASDLANNQRRAQMSGVNFDVPAGLLLDDPDGNQMLKSRGRQSAASGRQRSAPLAAVNKRSRNRVDCRLVGPFRRTIRASLDDDGDLQK